jgi:hypothetical protein
VKENRWTGSVYRQALLVSWSSMQSRTVFTSDAAARVANGANALGLMVSNTFRPRSEVNQRFFVFIYCFGQVHTGTYAEVCQECVELSRRGLTSTKKSFRCGKKVSPVPRYRHRFFGRRLKFS